MSREGSHRACCTHGEKSFLDWIVSSVDKDADFSGEEDDMAYAADPDDSDF